MLGDDGDECWVAVLGAGHQTDDEWQAAVF
jgi:hypothetical protein